jgi:hypothetical protein
MGIESFLRKVCVQTAVYWGNPVPDGFGGMTFDYPVEIKVRWDEKYKIVISKEGKEVTSTATILCSDDLDMEGRLFLGTLDDLWEQSETSSDGLIDPSLFTGVFEIMSREKVSMIKKTDQFVRTYYL